VTDTRALTSAQAAQADLSNRRGWRYSDERLTALHVNDVENIIERGRVLIEAKEELEPGSFEAMVKRHFDLRYARKLRIIAAHPVVSNRAHVHALPSSVFTLYELTKLPAAELIDKLKGGSINPRLERKQVATWRKGEQGEQSEQITIGGKVIERKPSLREQLKAAKAEVETLKAKLKRAGGSLFDLRNDKVKDMAVVVAANTSTERAIALGKAIIEAAEQRKRERQQRKRERQQPAG
jgi:hypothetical protein